MRLARSQERARPRARHSASRSRSPGPQPSLSLDQAWSSFGPAQAGRAALAARARLMAPWHRGIAPTGHALAPMAVWWLPPPKLQPAVLPSAGAAAHRATGMFRAAARAWSVLRAALRARAFTRCFATSCAARRQQEGCAQWPGCAGCTHHDALHEQELDNLGGIHRQHGCQVLHGHALGPDLKDVLAHSLRIEDAWAGEGWGRWVGGV